MAENPMSRDEVERMFRGNRWPMNENLIDRVFGEYYDADNPETLLYTDQDAWEQSRKLVGFFSRHGRMPDSLGEWMQGWQ